MEMVRLLSLFVDLNSIRSVIERAIVTGRSSKFTSLHRKVARACHTIMRRRCTGTNLAALTRDTAEGTAFFLPVARWAMHILRTTIAAATIGAIACTAAGAYPAALKLKLYAQNRPGETGTVTLEQIPGGVKIVVKMAGGQNGTQPIHIHTGTCAKLNPAPTYVLTNIVHGSSTTMIPAITLGDLLKGKYVLTSTRAAPI
jgi:hypothetical protein